MCVCVCAPMYVCEGGGADQRRERRDGISSGVSN